MSARPMAIRGRARGQRITVVREVLKVSAMVLGVTLLPIVAALMLAWGWST